MQTRLTALDLIGYAAGDERPRQFVHMPEQELDQELVSIKVFALSSHVTLHVIVIVGLSGVVLSRFNMVQCLANAKSRGMG